MGWTIELDQAAERDLDKINPQAARRILVFLRDRVAKRDNPRSVGTALQGSKAGGFWRYQVGDYRIIIVIEDDDQRILVLRVGHRREIYRRY